MALASLVVSLAANIAQFSEDMGKAAHISAKEMEKIQREAKKAGKAIGAMFVAGTATAAVLVKQAINSADAMSKMSQSAGIGIETLSQLDYVANLSGVSTETLANSLGKLGNNMADAAAGTGTASKAFSDLGISVKNADGSLKSSNDVLLEVAERIAGMEDGVRKSALASDIFGEKFGRKLIPMLNQGKDGIEALQAEAEKLGLTLDGSTGRAAEAFNDNLTRLNGVKKGIANTVMRELLPTLTNLTDRLVENAKNADLMDTAARAAATGLRILFTGAAILVGTFKALGEAWGALAASFALVAQGEFSKAWDVIKDGANNFNETITNTVMTVESIWRETAEGAETATKRVTKAQAPLIANEKELAKLAKDREKAAKDAQKAEQDFNDLMAKASMKRLQMQEEAARKAEEEHEKTKKRLEDGINGITESLLTEEERERESYTRRLALLIEAQELRIITEGEMMSLREQMEEQHRKKLEDIIKRSGTDLQKWEIMTTKQRTQAVITELQNMTNGVTNQSRLMFNINKAASLANAIMKGYEAIQNAYAFGSRFAGPVGGAAMAAVAAAATAAQVRAIASTQFGVGAAAPSVAGTTAASPVSVVQTPESQGGVNQPQVRRDVTIQINGSTFTRSQLEELVTGINELTEDGFPARFRMATA
jgi:hypothetical protein